jgi:hypothetical protein
MKKSKKKLETAEDLFALLSKNKVKKDESSIRPKNNDAARKSMHEMHKRHKARMNSAALSASKVIITH